jgi:tetratricopeptide (TPR) repeat protein
MDWLTGAAANKGQSNDHSLISAAMYAANQGNRFRTARTLQIIAELGAAMTGEGEGVNLLISDPLNGTDAAMLGSILDTHAPRDETGKNMIRPFLGMRDPEEAAGQWLRDAIADSPDWDWLPIFAGTNELRNGRNEEAIRSFSHALGVDPDNWVAYMHRAMASLQNAGTSKNRRDRQSAVRNATRDLQRAHDLESGNSFLFWVDGLLAGEEFDDGKFQRSIRAALMRHPPAMHISGNHFAGVSGIYLDMAKAKVDSQLETASDPFDLLLLRAMLMIWKDQHELAVVDLRKATELRPDHQEARGLLGLATFHLTTDVAERTAAMEAIDSACRSGSDIWLLHFFRLEQGIAANHAADVLDASLLSCEPLAITDWQRAITSIGRARHCLQNRTEPEAIEAFEAAIAADLAVDTRQLAEDAEAANAPELMKRLREYARRTGPETGFGDPARAIEQPALLNGDFELGLSFEWGNSTRSRDPSIWSNHEGCQSRAETSSKLAHSGEHSLHVMNPKIDGTGYGRMQQVFPATPGATYRVHCWLRTEDLAPDALLIGIADDDFQPVIRVGGQARDWTRFEGSFVAKGAEVVLEIRCQGKGEVWLDDVSIESERR